MAKIAIILALALILRIFGINWDQGYHLHPDERMLIMVAERIAFFDNLDPGFFNYGTLPIYILKAVSQFFAKDNYEAMLRIGRYVSVFFDLITIIFIWKTVKLLFKEEKIALFSSLLYALAFFPIQNAHFFVVDVPLTAFTTILIYLLVGFLKLHTLKKVISIAVVFAAMMATKVTAIIFLPVIVISLGIVMIKKLKRALFYLVVFAAVFFAAHYLFMPYAYIDSVKFIADTTLQIKMNSNPYIFPYTMQYVDSLPYLYHLQNIALWGLGPVIFLLCLYGMRNIKDVINAKNRKYFFLFIGFYLLYFLIVGRSAVKFMRYMLPLYPFLIALAGYGLYRLNKIGKVFGAAAITLVLIWSFMFVYIYSLPHTRIEATSWILDNIPAGSTIAVEHWDDRLPIMGGENYNFEELTLYDQPDDEFKWSVINEKLKKSDYIVIASNRLYVPLKKLSDCATYAICYPKVGEYYDRLFSGNLPFDKVAEFSVTPLFVNDQSADESFTVYDHPKIIIFKKK